MKISILGTNGFLSTAIAEYANQQQWNLDMYGLDVPLNHKYDNFYKINLMDAELNCSKLLDSNLIIYAIGAGIQANLKEGFNLIYNLNVTVPVTICNKLKELHYKGCFVTFGSVFEMGETKEERFFTEEDILTSMSSAPNDYTVSKRMLSKFVASYKHEFEHWHFYIPTIYGAGENPRRLIPYTISAILHGEKLSFTTGNQIRQYVYVGEIPKIIEKAYECKLPSGLYNIEGTETLSVREIVTLIHSSLGEKLPDGCFGTAQREDVGMKYLALDGKKLYDAIGYRPTIKIREIIKNYNDGKIPGITK